jgi:flagellar protein FlaG
MANEIGMMNPSLVAPVSRKDPLTPLAGAKPAEQQRDAVSEAKLSTEKEQPKDKGQFEELQDTVQELNTLVQKMQREVRFSVDDDSGEMVVKVVDRETEEVVRQIPSEEVVQLRQRLEEAAGAIFRDSA